MALGNSWMASIINGEYDAGEERYINRGNSTDEENGADAPDGPGINS